MRQHGGWILAKALECFGVTHAFGVPGESYLPLLDGLVETDIRFVNARHEGGASFMAAAWGQLTGEPGIAMVTRGPGATNAAIGVHTAMQGSLPMILFIGQVEQSMLGREAFQEIDYGKLFGDVAKWVIEIRETKRIPELIMRAWSVAMSGRKGPVVVVLPSDVLFDEIDAPLVMDPPKIEEAAPSSLAMREVTQRLEAAKRPLLLFGGTSWKADGRAALRALAERVGLPVMAAFRFQDGFDNHSPAYIGDFGLGPLPHIREAIDQSDLIVAVNLRFGENSTDGYTLFDLPKMKSTLIHTHVSADELNKIYQADLAIQCSPNAFAQALNTHEFVRNWQSWQSALRRKYEENSKPPTQNARLDMGAVMHHLQDVLDKDAILTNGAGNFAIWPSKYFRFGDKQRLIAPQSGAMGYGLPAAIAAKLYAPKRQVVCMAGDGDLQMTINELACARQIGAAPIVLLLNNQSYGTIRMHQEREFHGRVSGTDLMNPDFVAIAQGYGFYAERVERTEDFAGAFARAIKAEGGALIELATDIEHISPLRKISDL